MFSFLFKAVFVLLSTQGQSVAPQEVVEVVTEQRKDSTFLVKGKVYDYRSKRAIEAFITFKSIETGEVIKTVRSSHLTGDYQINLPHGQTYSFQAKSKGHYGSHQNIDAHLLHHYTVLGQDIELKPLKKGEIIRLSNILFKSNKATLKEESFEELKHITEILKESKELRIEVRGHTDNTGSDEMNLLLSEQRAKAVVDYLIKSGVDKSQLKSKGFGEKTPEKSNDFSWGRAWNRRVEFKVL